MLSQIKYSDLPSYKMGLQEGMELGVEQGIEQGLERGLEQGLEQGLERGIEQGATQKQQEVILNAHQAGLPLETIAAIVKLSCEEVRKLLGQLH